MKDDPKKKAVDGRFVSWQPHEIAYVKQRLKKLHPKRSAAEIADVMSSAKWMMGKSEGRARFIKLCGILLR